MKRTGFKIILNSGLLISIILMSFSLYLLGNGFKWNPYLLTFEQMASYTNFFNYGISIILIIILAVFYKKNITKNDEIKEYIIKMMILWGSILFLTCTIHISQTFMKSFEILGYFGINIGISLIFYSILNIIYNCIRSKGQQLSFKKLLNINNYSVILILYSVVLILVMLCKNSNMTTSLQFNIYIISLLIWWFIMLELIINGIKIKKQFLVIFSLLTIYQLSILVFLFNQGFYIIAIALIVISIVYLVFKIKHNQISISSKLNIYNYFQMLLAFLFTYWFLENIFVYGLFEGDNTWVILSSWQHLELFSYISKLLVYIVVLRNILLINNIIKQD